MSKQQILKKKAYDKKYQVLVAQIKKSTNQKQMSFEIRIAQLSPIKIIILAAVITTVSTPPVFDKCL